MTSKQSTVAKPAEEENLEAQQTPPIQMDVRVGEELNEKGSLEEIIAWEGLGNRTEARRLAETFLLRQESHAIRYMAMELAMFEDDLARAGHHALCIYQKHPWTWNGRKLLHVILGYTGYNREGYEVARQLHQETPDSFSGYDLACKAWSIGHREEAFRAALSAFSQKPANVDSLRKMFLDSELRGVWSYAAKRRVSLSDVLRWSYLPLELIVQVNRPDFPPREVDFADLPEIPPEFRILLRQRTPNTKVVDYGRARANQEIFQKFMQWQAITCLPKIGCLVAWTLRLRRKYDEALPAMVRFCAKRGRPGTARYMLRQFLHRHPETEPDSLGPIAGLEYWIEEWRRLRDIDPEGTKFLINLRPQLNSWEDFEDAFAALPRTLRESGQGWMVLGCVLCFAGKNKEALDAFRSALSFWPQDEALHLNILLCLSRLERWEEAERIVCHTGFLAATPELAEFSRRAIAERSRAITPPNPQDGSLFPTPSYGYPHRQEDIIFLREFLRSGDISNRVET